MSSNLIDRTTDWGIAKLVKASDSESDMRRFESYYPCHTIESPVFSEHRAFSCSLSVLRRPKPPKDPKL